MQQTEGETDTGSDVSDNNTVKVKHIKAPTKTGSDHNLFQPDDEKNWNDSFLSEARDMKRQLKHYITESNLHDVHGLPGILNISPSDLESGAETGDNYNESVDNSTTMNLLFPVKSRNRTTPTTGGSTTEAVSVRDKLDSVQTNVNGIIENLEHEKKNIKDKNLLDFLQTLQQQLSSVQDNVEDADMELKTEERKYHNISKEYEKASKKYQALKEKQERDEREKAERLIKEQETKLKEQQQQIYKLQQMAMQVTQGGPALTPHGNAPTTLQAFVTPYALSQQSPRGSVGPPPLGATMIPHQQAQQGAPPTGSAQNIVALNPKLDALAQASSIFSDDTVQVNHNMHDGYGNNDNNNNNTTNHNSGYQNDTAPMMPITNALRDSPHSPQNRGRDKHRNSGGRYGAQNSRSLSRRNGSKHNRYTSHSNDSSAVARMNEPPHISDLPSDEDIFGGNNNNNNNNNHNTHAGNHRHSNQNSHNSHGSGGHGHGMNRARSDPQNGPIEIGHRSSNEMLDETNRLGRSGSNNSSARIRFSNQNPNQNHPSQNNSNNNNNNNNRHYLNNMNNNNNNHNINHVLSVSSSSRAGGSVPNNGMDLAPLSVGSGSQPRVGMMGNMYASPQPGVLYAQPSEGPGYNPYDISYPNVSYPVGYDLQQSQPPQQPQQAQQYHSYNNSGHSNNMNMNLHNNNSNQIQQSQSRPLISDTGIKIIGGVVVVVAAVWIISKYFDNDNDSIGPAALIRRPPRPHRH